MNKMQIEFDGKQYTAKYNEQTKLYEIEIETNSVGGIYSAKIKYEDLIGNISENEQKIQVFAKEKIKTENNKVFMWVFDWRDFKVKDIIELTNYDINIDEETNATTILNILKETSATAEDIIAVKRNNEIIYWGIIDNIQNEDGEKLFVFTAKYITNIFNETVELKYEAMIKENGIEDFIAKTIIDNYIDNKEDTFLNRKYLEVVVETHTKLQKTVDNIENGIYNLHTWMTNCTQNYNIIYKIEIINKKIRITIKKEELKKELIDMYAQGISNYTEVFETNVVSKVKVLTKEEGTYTLFLLNDRTTTTDKTNKNRAYGTTKIIYTEKMENANQVALDEIRQNIYKHMIKFNMIDKYIRVGTPIAAKTKKSIVLDTYISAIRITPNKFYEYICGNMRINFIDKLLKERK